MHTVMPWFSFQAHSSGRNQQPPGNGERTAHVAAWRRRGPGVPQEAHTRTLTSVRHRAAAGKAGGGGLGGRDGARHGIRAQRRRGRRGRCGRERRPAAEAASPSLRLLLHNAPPVKHSASVSGRPIAKALC